MLHLISGLLSITPYILCTYTTLFKNAAKRKYEFIHCSLCLEKRKELRQPWFCQFSFELKKPQCLNEARERERVLRINEANYLERKMRFYRADRKILCAFWKHRMGWWRKATTKKRTVNRSTNTHSKTEWENERERIHAIYICMAWLWVLV